MADYAVYKFKSIAPKQRLSKLGQVMNYMQPYTDDHKFAIQEMKKMGISLSEQGYLQFEMLDPRDW